MTDDQFETLHELLSAIYVQTARIYDVLAIIGDKLGADVLALSQEHEQGKLLGPPPLFTDEEEENETT